MVESIRIIDQNEYEFWDDFVAKSPQGTIFHKSYWLEASGRDFRIYGYFKGTELLAGFPICYRKSHHLGFRFAYHPPLTPYLGSIFKKSDSKYVTRISNEKEINRAFAKRIKQDFDVINFRFSYLQVDIQPFIWEGFSSGVRYTYIIELDDMDRILMEMDSKFRNHISRAIRDNLYVKISGNFDKTFALVEKTFERQKEVIDFKEEALAYNKVLRKKNQCTSFHVVDRDNEIISVIYLVWDEKRCYLLLSGYDYEKSHSGAEVMAVWEAMKFVKEKLNLKQFDFEGSMIEPVEMFFRKFGGRLTPTYTVSWSKPYVTNIYRTVDWVSSKLMRKQK